MSPLWRLGAGLEHPEWATAALVLWLAAAVAVAAARRRARRRVHALLGPRAPRAHAASDVIVLVALAAVAIALLGPRIGTRSERLPGGGVDVVVLLDVSRSMDARDLPPSRLHRARRAAREVLAELRPGDRVALAAFADRGVLLTPLSQDLAAVAELVGAVDADLMRDRGSDLDAGVVAALRPFASDEDAPRARAVLVLGDGERSPGAPRGAGAAEAIRARARVVSVAFGSEAGAAVPQGDGWLRDRNGAPVRSRRDGEALRAIASLTDGAVFEADAWGEVDIAALAAELRRDAGGTAGEAGRRRVPAVRVAPFALLGFLLLAAELGSPWIRGRPRRSWARAGAAATAALLALALLAPGEPFAASDSTDAVAALEAHLRGHPGDPRALLALGLARAERGQRAGAERAFRAAALLARDDGLAALAYYDLGVAALERGALAEARDAFFDAVALDPGSPRALHNLEWTLAALAARQQAPPPPTLRPESSGDRGRPKPTPQPEGREGDRARHPRPAPLDPDEVRRWLEQAEDDPRRGLRAGARGSEPQPSRDPAW